MLFPFSLYKVASLPLNCLQQSSWPRKEREKPKSKEERNSQGVLKSKGLKPKGRPRSVRRQFLTPGATSDRRAPIFEWDGLDNNFWAWVTSGRPRQLFLSLGWPRQDFWAWATSGRPQTTIFELGQPRDGLRQRFLSSGRPHTIFERLWTPLGTWSI